MLSTMICDASVDSDHLNYKEITAETKVTNI